MVVVIGLGGLFLSTLVRHTTVDQTFGVIPVYPVAPLEPGQEVCESPVGLAHDVVRVRFNIGTRGKPGVPFTVTLRDPATRQVLAGGGRASGWIDNGTAQNIPVGHVRAGRFVAACVRNRGRNRAYVWGDYYRGKFQTGPLGVRPTLTTAVATIDGRQLKDADISMAFVANKPHSLLAKLPDAFRHASVFRPPSVGAWTFWLLAVLIALGAPLLLWRALRSALRASVEAAPEPPEEEAAPPRELVASGAEHTDS